ncbi:MAG: LamG-like jellyroll fold domain-containing protein [Candidatus Methanomethylicaceae archaeon]
MIRRGFRSSSVGQPAENPHPKLCALLQMGDGINEPQGLGRHTSSGITGTVVEGAFPGSYARRYSGSGGHTLIRESTTATNYREAPWTAMFFIRFVSSPFEAWLFLSPNTGRPGIRIKNSEIIFATYETYYTTYAKASVSLSTNTWYHVAISCGSSSGQWKMWLNGTPLSLSINGSAMPLGYTTGTEVYLVYLTGSYTVDIDHVKVYEGQLSDAEVVVEMNKKVW